MVRPALYLRLSQRRLRRARYRVRQFVQGLHAQVTDAERRQVAAILPAPAQPIFACMPLDAQRHSLNVLHTLQAAGQIDSDLAVAALLHDAGKAAAGRLASAWGCRARGPLVLAESVRTRAVAPHGRTRPVPPLALCDLRARATPAPGRSPGGTGRLQPDGLLADRAPPGSHGSVDAGAEQVHLLMLLHSGQIAAIKQGAMILWPNP